MSSSSNTKTSETNTENNLDSRQYNLQEIDGPAVVGGAGDMTMRYTDQGAVEAGRDVTLEALDTGGQVVEDAFGFGLNVQREATESQRQAVSALEQSNRTMRGAQSDAMEFADEATRDENARNTETMIKWGAAAAVLAVAVPSVVAAMRG